MTDPVENFIEQMGLLTQKEGGARISGRIFGLLIVEGRALSLQEIAERLKVSKASVSTNARLLADRGLLRLTSQPGARQDYYELVPDPYRQMTRTISDGMRKTATVIAEARENFPDELTEAKERIRQLAEFYSVSADLIADWSAKLPTTE